MKKGTMLSVLTIIMGIIMVLYIGVLGLPHMDYAVATKVPTADGTDTELVMVEDNMSVLSFLAFPNSGKETAIKNQMKQKLDDTDYTINGVTTGPLLLILLAVLGAVACFLKRDKFIASFLPLAWCIFGIYVYMTNNYIRLGGADYWVQLALLVIAGVLAIVLGAVRLPGVIADRKQIREEIRITKQREAGIID